jgi:DNA polymerase-3 subunit delta'
VTFAQIIGHDRQKDILRRALAGGRLAHAYLFAGPEGVGKRLMALAVARVLFCSVGTGCGECAACRKLDHRNHPDLHVLEPDGNSIKIEQVRAIQRDLSLRPVEGSRKVCLLEAAETMTTAAANALLKTLEAGGAARRHPADPVVQPAAAPARNDPLALPAAAFPPAAAGTGPGKSADPARGGG